MKDLNNAGDANSRRDANTVGNVNSTRGVLVDGCETPFDIALSQMDDELREQLQAREELKTDQAFVDAYARAHERKFGEPFSLG